MATNPSDVLANIAEELGPELYTACAQNNVAQVQALTSNIDSMNWQEATMSWASVALAAASEGAYDVASYCFRDPSGGGVKDYALGWVADHEILDPAYRFLLERRLVDVNHGIDRTGTVLALVAGYGKNRHSLAEYMLQKGAWPNQRSDIFGRLSVLTTAAGYSDKRMIELLLDHGAQIQGTGALIFASRTGKVENLKFLLNRGADVNEMVPLSDLKAARENVGSPLHKAVEQGHISVVDILLGAGADVTLKDGEGRTAAEIAREKGVDSAIVERLSPMVKGEL